MFTKRGKSHSNLKRLATIAALAAGSLMWLWTALADTADAQRVEERLPDDKQPVDQTPNAPKLSPAQADQDASLSIPEFELRFTRIEGVTAIDKKDADACAVALVGKAVGAADLVQLTDCITDLYRARGFFLSRAIVPKQEVKDGNLNVRVVEGYIAAIAPEGMGESDAISQFAGTLGERPVHLATFERDLLLLSDRYGYRITSSQLLADPQDLARYTFRVKVTVVPVSWRIYADNRGNGSSGSDQVYGSVAWNSLATSGDKLATSLFTSPSETKDLFYADIGYALPWLDGALWTEAGASVSRTRDPAPLLIDTTQSESERYFFRATSPLVRSRAQSLWATLLFEGRESSQFSADEMMSDERLRVLRGSLSYTLVEGATRGDIAIEVSHGLDALGASVNGDPMLTRSDGRPHFTKVRLDAAFAHKFSEHWSMSAYLSGQHADGGLVSVEEFGAGGSRYGRAYDYSEITGDDGVAAAMELRYTLANIADWLKSLQFYAFADGAMIWNRSSDPSALSQADLSSAGLGIRLTPIAGVTVSFELAQPLSRDIADKGDRGLRPFVTLQLGW